MADMSRILLKEFNNDLQQVLKPIKEKYNVNFEFDSIKWINDYEIQMNTNVTDADVDIDKIRFENECEAYGFKPTDYKKIFTMNNGRYMLLGFDKRYTGTCLIQSLDDGKRYESSSFNVWKALRK